MESAGDSALISEEFTSLAGVEQVAAMNTFPNPDAQFKPGQSGNINGRPKGRRSLATIIRETLEGDINWDLIPVKDAKKFSEQYKDKAAWEALVDVAFGKALSGDTRAMAWLTKSGYGDRLTLDAAEGLFKTGRKLEINVVDSPTTVEQDAESSPPATE